MYQDDNDNNNYLNNDDPTPNFDEGSNFDLKSGAPDVVKMPFRSTSHLDLL